MIQKKIILLNGPAGTNKTELCEVLVNQHGFKHLRIDGEFKRRVHAFYGDELLTSCHFKDSMDNKSGFFYGKTPKSVYQDLSNHFHIKNPKFMVSWLIDEIDNLEDVEYIIVEDIKYAWEARYLIDYYGSNALLVRLYKNGCSFNNNWGYVERIHTKTSSGDYRYANLYNKDDMKKLVEDLKFIFLSAFNKEI